MVLHKDKIVERGHRVMEEDSCKKEGVSERNKWEKCKKNALCESILQLN